VFFSTLSFVKDHVAMSSNKRKVCPDGYCQIWYHDGHLALTGLHVALSRRNGGPPEQGTTHAFHGSQFWVFVDLLGGGINYGQ
jgi:hypothetical protein